MGDFDTRLVPTLLLSDSEIEQISCGDYHLMILKKNGEVYGTGRNSNGQLCIDNNEHHYINKLTYIMTDKNIKSIHCSTHATFILKKNSIYQEKLVDELWACGSLGHLTSHTLILITRAPNIKSISSGLSHCMIIINDKLFSFGSNRFGQLGSNDHDSRNQPTFVNFNGEIDLLMNGTREIVWTTQNHKNFSMTIKNRIFTFLLILKRKCIDMKFYHIWKVPKPILFMIFNLMV